MSENGFLGEVFKKWPYVVRALVFFGVLYLVIVATIIGFIIYFNSDYNKITKIETDKIGISFQLDDKKFEIINLPANQICAESTIILEEGKEYTVSASGLVSTKCDDYYAFLNQFIIEKKDVINSADIDKYNQMLSRDLRISWNDPNGKLENKLLLETKESKCSKHLKNLSEELKLYRKMRFGSLLMLLVNKNIANNDVHKHLKDSTKVLIIPIGKRAEFSLNDDDEFKIKYFNSDTLYKNNTFPIAQDFIDSRIYFTINDTYIKSADNIKLVHKDSCELIHNEIRKFHKFIFDKIEKREGIWYADNNGSLNIVIEESEL